MPDSAAPSATDQFAAYKESRRALDAALCDLIRAHHETVRTSWPDLKPWEAAGVTRSDFDQITREVFRDRL